MRLYKLFFIVAIPISILSCQKPIEEIADAGVAAKTMLNVSYGSDVAQNMDIYLPGNRSTTSTKVMVTIHGGGWSAGDKSDLTPYVDSLRNRLPDYAIFNINYRLAIASNLFPKQEMDIKSAVEFIASNASSYLISQKFVLLGVSAGAHLALLQGYKYSSPVKPKAIVSFFGPTDLIDMYNHPTNALVPQGLASVVGKTPTQDSLLYANSSPVNFVNSTSSPTILLHGGLDPLVSVTQATMLKAKLDVSGVINQFVLYPTEGHGWFGATLSDSFNKIQAFLATNVN
ncbi:MAG: alpha/beta hydrolase [Bacteroidota bacterium]|nr:alpha/beta hydrolase [Bacteroidota bacterium]